jgi:hypothetical protein
VVYLLRLTKVWESTMKILKFLFVDSTVNILVHGMLDVVFDGIGRGESCERLSRLGALDTASLTLGTKLVRH